MKKIIVILIAVSSLPAFAQEGKITKAKGNKAVVEFPAGTKLRAGDAVSVGSQELDFPSSSSSSGSSDIRGSREHSIDFSFNFLTGSQSSGGSHTVISIAGKYGWNKVTMEYGPEASFSTSTPGSVSSFGGGGFFDYNLIPNKPGTTLVYGVGGDALLGSVSGSGNSATTMTFFGGGFGKWFPLGNTVAVRGDGGLGYTRLSASSATTSETDVVVKGALEVYF